MAKKKQTLVDSFLFESAQKKVSALTEKKDGQGADTIRTPCGQDGNVQIPSKYRPNNVMITLSGQDKDTIKNGHHADTIASGRIRLPRQQKALYEWFIQRGFTGNFTKPMIVRETGIPLETIRKSLRKFKKISLIFFTYDVSAKEYEYEINTRISVIKTDTIRTPYGQGADTIRTLPQAHCSSSLLNNKTITCGPDDIEKALADHPELGYWRQKNLTAKQVQEWMKTAGCGLETMIQHLCWCRFDMVDRGLETSKPIKNVFNWFFRIIEKTGGYPRPEAYKSFIEKQIEEEQRLADEQQKQIERLKALRRDKWERQRELEFWQMMNEPEGALYQQCFEQLSRFDRQRAKKGGKAFEAAMRRRFDEVGEG